MNSTHPPLSAEGLDMAATRAFFVCLNPAYTLDNLLEIAENVPRTYRHPTTEAAALRSNLVRTFHEGGSLGNVFPGRVTSWATNRLAQICLDQELRIGLEVQQLDELRRRKRSAFIGRLAMSPSSEEQHKLEEVLSALRPDSQELLLRRLSGESFSSIAFKKNQRTKDSAKLYQALSKRGYRYTEVAEGCVPFFPAKRSSLFESFEPHLPELDKDSELLAKRLHSDGADFDRIALSLFNADVPAGRAAILLRDFNIPYYPGGIRGVLRAGDETALTEYRRSAGHLLQACNIKAIQRPFYEERPEGIRFILEIIEHAQKKEWRKTRPTYMNSAQQQALARDIEIGMWADMRLALADPERAEAVQANMTSFGREPPTEWEQATEEELKTIAERGSEAFSQFVRTHVRLAIWTATGINRSFNYILKPSDAFLAGMQGIVRALRKFEYKKGFEFGTYAGNWINYFMHKAIRKELGVSSRVWEDWCLAKASRKRLTQHLQREPSYEEVAKDAGLQVHKIQEADKHITNVLYPIEYDDTKANSSSQVAPLPASSTSSLCFSSESKAILGKIFIDKPVLAQVIILSFQDGLEPEEIGRTLNIHPRQAAAFLTSAKEILAKKLDPETLLKFTQE